MARIERHRIVEVAPPPRFQFWKPLRKKISKPVQEYLSEDEWAHMELASFFVPQEYARTLTQKQYRIPIDGNTGYYYSCDEEIRAVLGRSRYGMLSLDIRAFRRNPGGFSQSAIRSGSGAGLEPGAAAELEELLDRFPVQQFVGRLEEYTFLSSRGSLPFRPRHYQLMLRPERKGRTDGDLPGELESGGKNPWDLHFRPISEEEGSALWPLEKAYYLEEVFTAPPDQKELEALKRRFQLRMRHYLQYGLFDRGKLVARAMVNLYGLRFWQLGGVYTVPEWRSRGLACFLVGKLCRTVRAAGRRPMLFVRPDNLAAIRLYQRCGFHFVSSLVVAQ